VSSTSSSGGISRRVRGYLSKVTVELREDCRLTCRLEQTKSATRRSSSVSIRSFVFLGGFTPGRLRQRIPLGRARIGRFGLWLLEFAPDMAQEER
jgi:hypothetical protein